MVLLCCEMGSHFRSVCRNCLNLQLTASVKLFVRSRKKTTGKFYFLLRWMNLKERRQFAIWSLFFFLKKVVRVFFSCLYSVPWKSKLEKRYRSGKASLSILHFLSQKSLTFGDEKATFKKTTDNFLDLKRPNSAEGSSKKKKTNYAMQKHWKR